MPLNHRPLPACPDRVYPRAFRAPLSVYPYRIRLVRSIPDLTAAKKESREKTGGRHSALPLSYRAVGNSPGRIRTGDHSISNRRNPRLTALEKGIRGENGAEFHAPSIGSTAGFEPAIPEVSPGSLPLKWIAEKTGRRVPDFAGSAGFAPATDCLYQPLLLFELRGIAILTAAGF